MSRVEIKLEDDLLELGDERAAVLGKTRDEVIAEAVRRQLDGRQLPEIIEAARKRSGLSAEEAMQLAIAEQKGYRTSRRELSPGSQPAGARCQRATSALCPVGVPRRRWTTRPTRTRPRRGCL